MSKAAVTAFEMWEDSTASLMARIEKEDGSDATQSDINSVKVSVFDLSGDSATAVSGFDGKSLTVSNVVYDSLQTDSRWTADATGYNFRYDLPASAVPDAVKYRVEVIFTPSAGSDSKFAVVYEPTAKQLYTS